jgi:glycosyltransferase involved in cell wall biosynthesis
MERGFGVLPALLQRLPATIAGRPVVLVVQVDRKMPDPRVREVLQRLEARLNFPDSSRPRVELIDGPVSEVDYFAHLASADVLLTPLLSSKYECSTSGVFVEGIRLGIPAVVMRGTWTASIVENARSLGCRIGVIVQQVGAIAECVVEISESLAEYEAGVAAYLASRDIAVEPSIPSLLLAASAGRSGATHGAVLRHPDEAR